MDLLTRIIFGLGGLGFLVAYFAWKWKRAGQVSDAMAVERSAAKESFEMLKRDPRFQQLWQYMAPRFRATFDAPQDAATYCIRYLALTDAAGQPVFGHAHAHPAGGSARYLMAYLERKDGPARVRVSMDLATGVCGETELGALAWSAVIPVMY